MSEYIPSIAVIDDVRDETHDTKTFRIKLKRGKLNFESGQFVQVSVFGIGEAPISISSSPSIKECFELTIRNVGNVTASLHKMKKGDQVGIRGPYGHGYPLKELSGKNIVFVTGGCGIAPLKSVIDYVCEKRQSFGTVDLFYGARSPEEFDFKKDLEKWKEKISVHLSIDKPSPGWKGFVGFVTQLLEKEKLNADSYVLSCGAPLMIDAANTILKKKGIKEDRIYVSLERQMKCGVGVCCHCSIGKKFVCKEGPVFRLDRMPRE